VPSYKFTSLIKKQNLIFRFDEIISAEKCSLPLGSYKIFFRTKLHYGYFIHIGNIAEQAFEELVKKNHFMNLFKDTFKEKNLSFKYPTIWLLLFTLVLLIAWIPIAMDGHIFAGYLKPEMYANAYCGIKCIRQASSILNISLLPVSTWLGGGISIYFFFYFSSKIRDAQSYSYSKRISFIYILALSSVMIWGTESYFPEANLKKAIVAFHLTYTPDYFKNSNNRKIASEIMGTEIKEKKNFK
jgi:hypothetical protein